MAAILSGTYPYTGTKTVGQTSNGQLALNQTRVSLSTQILIQNDMGDPIGAVKSLSITETGQINQVMEVGTDGVIDSYRSGSVKITGSCNRTRFAKARIAEAFGRSYIHVASQAYPFDIQIIDKCGATPEEWITTIIKNVWIASITYTYSESEWVITDNMTWNAETIYSFVGTSGNKPASQGYALGNKIAYVNLSDSTTGGLSVEQATDTGLSNRRGSLDIPGLIDATWNSKPSKP